MHSGLVSIMMPAYNAELYIAQAIESILAQTYENWELIVVNDGSTDRTGEVAAQFSDHRIRVLHQSNQGESVARNVALTQSRGEFIAFLDADDMWLPHHLEATVHRLTKETAVDAVYTDGHYCDIRGNSTVALSSRRRGPFEGWIFEEVVRASDVFGPPICVVLRRSLIQAHDLRFDPEIVIGPDWDFMARYAEVGRFAYLAQPTCRYRIHETNITIRTNRQRRALSLARCREKAIRLSRFGDCSAETRTAVFYDLLVNLLHGHDQRQDDLTQSEQFQALPRGEQARLLRLMAANSIHAAVPSGRIRSWLARSRQLNPRDIRGAMVDSLYRLSPNGCRSVLHLKRLLQTRGSWDSPFGELV